MDPMACCPTGRITSLAPPTQRRGIKNEGPQLREKEIPLVVTRGRGGGREDWRKVVKRVTFPVARHGDAVRRINLNDTDR